MISAVNLHVILEKNKHYLLGLINPSLFNIVYLVIFPKLVSYYYCTRVWGTHLEVICHLLHMHASVYVPLGAIPTL